MEGWILKYRKIEEHWLHPLKEKRKFTKYEAWEDLLFKASYENKKMLYKGKLINIEVGECIISAVKLAERWKWDRETVKSFLDTLCNENMINMRKIYPQNVKSATMIFINKYKDYQLKNENQPTLNPAINPALKPALDSTLLNNINNKNKINNKGKVENFENNDEMPDTNESKDVLELNNYFYNLIKKQGIVPPKNYLFLWAKNANEILDQDYRVEDLKKALDWCFSGYEFAPNIITEYKGNIYPNYKKLVVAYTNYYIKNNNKNRSNF